MSFNKIAFSRPLLTSLLLFSAASLSAQQNHDNHSSGDDSQAHGSGMMHTMHHQSANQNTTMTSGQSIMDVISQVIRDLEANPNTDWSQVNIDTLRQHLLDMDRLATSATATAQSIPGGSHFQISGDDPQTVAAIHRMVPAHAAQIETELGWTAAASLSDSGATLHVVGTNSTDELKIRALGFLGFMTLGDHHTDHHLQMASGQSSDSSAHDHSARDHAGHQGH